MIRVIGWIGAACLMVAPFLINFPVGKLLIMLGLTLLTMQALQFRAFNLVTANVFGIVGYAWSLFT